MMGLIRYNKKNKEIIRITIYWKKKNCKQLQFNIITHLRIANLRIEIFAYSLKLFSLLFFINISNEKLKKINTTIYRPC